MSSQQRRAPRNGARADSNDGLNKKEIWEDIRSRITAIRATEQETSLLREKLLAAEENLSLKKNTPEGNLKRPIFGSNIINISGAGISIADIDEASILWREGIRLAEVQKSRINDELRTRLELLRDIQKAQEKEKEQEKSVEEGSVTGRASSSRASGVDFDGPSDSPIPSPADNRQARKFGASRTSSQPPRGIGEGKDTTPSEASERASKPKIVYHQGQEVAFKRKIPNSKGEEQDWIQGRVVRVIGEGKSRRYEVKDPYPDENSGGTNVYKSSASQMVPIPPEGATLGDYEAGRTVLALYPETTTFYRAEVKAMLEGGTQVQLLFEGETDAQLSTVARRFVLDHKG